MTTGDTDRDLRGRLRACKKKLRQLEKAFATMQIGVTITDTDGRIIFVNPADARMHGYSVEELLGHDVGIYASPDERKKLPLAEMRSLESWSRESVNLRQDGSRFPVQITSDAVFDSGGEPLGVVSSCQDISERKERERALEESEQRYALVMRGTNDALWDWDVVSGVVYFSPRWKEMLGFGEDVGTSPEEWFSRVHPEDQPRLRRKVREHLEGLTRHFEDEHRMLAGDGSYRWMRSRGVAVRDDSGSPLRLAGSQADITGLKVKDPLTGLSNRLLLVDHLTLAIARARRLPNSTFAVLFMDLDRFKVINDSLGHVAGDQLLLGIARRFEKCLRPSDTFARFGGDEFTILLEDLQGVTEAVHVTERLLGELASPFDIAEQEVFATASVGIVLASKDYRQPEDLLRDADLAMYRAKDAGGGTYRIFDAELRRSAVALMEVETELRHALDNGEMRVYYQPILSLKDRRIAGFEALVRWQHPERGLLEPKDFLAVAEETGLIVPIGEWVLEEACTQVRKWQRLEVATWPLSIGVNFGAKQLAHPDLSEKVRQILDDTGLPPGCLNLEITETTLLQQTGEITRTLTMLRKMGIHVCLDDFGTGYSSLSYLQQFPIDTLKIDRSFVKRLSPTSKSFELVRSIIDLGRNLHISVVAEGIETANQLASLKDLACDFGQGFSFSRPLDARQAEEFLAAAFS